MTGPAIRSIPVRALLACMLLFALPTASFAQADTTAPVSDESPLTTDTSSTFTLIDNEQSQAGKYFTAIEYQDRSADTVRTRHIADSVTRRLKQEDDFWYADKDFRKKKEVPEETREAYTPLLERLWFRTLLWLVVIGGFVAFIIWYLAGNEFGLFRKTARSFQESPQEEEMPENIFEINYQRELEKAIARGDYRLGVRLLYLQLLKRMAEKSVISYKQDKTNSDYLFTLLGSKYYDGFFRMTRHYEYTWYGHFDVPESTFGIIRQDFDQYQKQYL